VNWLTISTSPRGVRERAVHHAVVVVHHSQAPDLVGQLARRAPRVVVCHADQHSTARTDLPDDLVAVARRPSPTPQHPLHQATHDPSLPYRMGPVIELRQAQPRAPSAPRTEAVVASLVVDSDAPDRRARSRRFRQPDGEAFRWCRGPAASRDGRFSFDGVEHQCRSTSSNTPYTHRVRTELELVDRDATSCSRVAISRGWSGHVDAPDRTHRQRSRDLTLASSGRSGDAASIGWHPWFVKPTRTDSAASSACSAATTTTSSTAPSSAPTTAAVGRLLPWSTGYATRAVDRRPSRCRSTARGEHWVVYDMPPQPTCVEPQTATPDAFNLPARPAEWPGGARR
jgi:hypothetical protein